MSFDYTKYDILQFIYDPQFLGKVTGMSEKYVLEHFKETFPKEIEAQLHKQMT